MQREGKGWNHIKFSIKIKQAKTGKGNKQRSRAGHCGTFLQSHTWKLSQKVGKLENSLCYTVRPCLKKGKKNKIRTMNSK
jgi:hypothetical protein